MNKFLHPLVLGVFLLSGCDGGKDIEKVKDYVFSDLDNSRTVGTVMAHRYGCTNGKWSSEVDSSGRKLVAFSCDVDIGKINDYFNSLKDKNVVLFKSKLDKYQAEVNEQNKQKRVVDSIYKAANSNLDTILADYNEMAKYGSNNADGFVLSSDQKSKIDTVKIADYENLRSMRAGLTSNSENAADSLMDSFSESDLNSSDNIKNEKISLSLIYSAYIKELPNLYKNEIEYFNNQINRKSSINLTSGKSVVYFSSNPSTNDPVSFLEMKYNLRNNGDDINTTGGDLASLYNGGEIRSLEIFLYGSYYKSAGY